MRSAPISTTHYRSGATVIGAAGAVDHDAICDEAERRFAGLSARNREIETRARPATRGGDMRLQAAARTGPYRHRLRGHAVTRTTDFYAMQVFANAVGGGMSSRLFQEVRESARPRLFDPRLSLGLFRHRAVRLLCRDGAKDVAELHAGRARLPRPRRRMDFSDAEVRRAKAQMKVSLLAALESPAARASRSPGN